MLLFFSVHQCGKKAHQQLPPNILIINVDDLGWADPSFMGNRFYETPAIDELSSRGMIFTQGYAAAANCAPSRACMMTGMNTPRHGIYTVGSSERGRSADRRLIPVANKVILHDSLTTLSEALQVYGYTTCHAGKWHLSENPKDYGFDYTIGGSNAGHPKSYKAPYGNVNLEAPENEYLTDNVMNHVLEFLDSRHGDPFFLYYAPYAVHTPIQAVDSLLYKFQSKQGPAGMSDPEYATMLNNLDRNIGRLIRKLKDLDFYNNTFIIFTSDNGGLYRISHQKPLRAGKGSYYEGGIRVPLFFVWEGKIEAGINETVPAVNLDFFPTILDIIDAELPGKSFDGIDLAPLLLKNKMPETRPLFWHFPIYLEGGNIDTYDTIFRTRPGSAIRYGDWKLQHFYENGIIELYNLASDPGEENNLVDSFSEKAEELQSMLDTWIDETGAFIPSEINPDFIGKQGW